MNAKQLRNLFLIAAGGLAVHGCSPKEPAPQEEKPQTTEVVAIQNTPVDDPYGNIALFEATRSKIKFSLAFVENFYDYTYHCGKLAKGYGMTVIYDENGKGRNVCPGETCTMDGAIMDMDRYLTFSCLKSIRDDVKVSLDENTLLAACVIQYCIGPTRFRNSSFLQALNNGATGKELVKWLTLYRIDPGVLKRCYFFAAMVCEKMEFSDLLDVRADGCYNLVQSDILLCKTTGRTDKVKNIKKDADNCGIWNFDNLQQNLEIAKKPRTGYVTIEISPKKQTKKVECKFVKDIVPDDVWNGVSNGRARIVEIPQDTISFADAQKIDTCGQLNDSSFVAYNAGDYETALAAGKAALQFAKTNKEIGAANYNIGITYLAMGKYEPAVKYLRASLAVNKTDAAEGALKEAMQKRQSTRTKWGGYGLLGASALTAILVARRRSMMQRQKHR